MAQLRALGGILAMVFIGVAAVVALGLGGGSPSATSAADATVTSTAASTRGRELYLSSCASCHGPDGRGTEKGPTLERAGTAAWDFYLRSGRMPLLDPEAPLEPGPPAFDEADIESLVAYGRQLGDGPERPRLVSDASLAAGRELYVNDCSACHGVTASGAGIGPDVFAPSLRGVEEQLIAEAPLVGPGSMPDFALDDEQLSAIAAYVHESTTAPSPGGFELRGFGPVAEGLVAMFVGLIAILVAARWIGTSARRGPTSGEDDGD